MISRLSKTTLFSALTVVALTSIPAIAQTVSRAVHYADLDLSSPAGRMKLDHRIAAAVREVCGGEYDARELALLRAQQSCRKAAMENALPQIARTYASAGQRTPAAVLASR